MNILFITIAWPRIGERNLYSDLMVEFKANGHTVYVIATDDQLLVQGQKVQTENGINLFYIASGKIRKTKLIIKAISLLNLGNKIYKTAKSSLPDIKFDLIFGHTPPITLSNTYRKLKKKYNAPFYLLLKDIWPQGSVDNKVINKYSLIWLYLRIHEVRLYKIADHIGCMSQMGVKYLLSKNKFLKNEKVEVCPNSIRPTEEFRNIDQVAVRQRFEIPSNAVVFIFSGNLGKGHGLEFLVEGIKKMAYYPKAFFLIGGSGTHFKFLKRSFENYEGGNIMLYSWLSFEDFTMIMQTSNVGLILLNKCYTVPQFPSRLLTYLDHGKPVLCVVNQSTDIGTIVEEKGCGRKIIHGDLEGFEESIKYFCENPEQVRRMGIMSRSLLLEEFQVSNAYKIITNSLSWFGE